MTKPKTLIIAEAGVNHNGKLDVARELIDAAAMAGADIVKFQTFRADRLTIPKADKADYQKQATDAQESQYEMLRRLELTRKMHEDLIDHCNSAGVKFLSTAFDIESIELLVELKIERIKIPSGEITNLPYLRAIGKLGLPIIMSTGMATLGEVEVALDAIELAGASRQRITVLHCNTDYPTHCRDVNLLAMLSMAKAFRVAVGYSDHTLGSEVAVAAVALGATIIEKHLTLNRSSPGPDHRASLDPDEFKAMTSAIRNIEAALGDGIKRPTAGELKNKPIVRKSLVAARTIRAGERFEASNLMAKRPGTGLSPMRWDEIIGRVASRDFAADEAIEL